MFVRREEGELFLQGSHHTPPANGWLERVDPVTLEPVAASPMLSSGGHSWCGAVAAHENGDLYMVNGRYVHRLDTDCRVIVERELPLDAPYNGLLVLPDGHIVTKNLQREDDLPCTFSVLEPDRLELVGQLTLPMPSMGRFCADRGSSGDVIYVASERYVHRLRYRSGQLAIDETWQADYSVDSADQSPAWDPCIGGGNLWLQDMGRPPGWRGLAATAPLRVFRFASTIRSQTVIVPFGDGSAFSPGPSLFDPDGRVLVTYDFANGRTGAWRWTDDDRLEHLWTRDVRSANQPFVYRDTRELVTEDAAGRAPRSIRFTTRGRRRRDPRPRHRKRKGTSHPGRTRGLRHVLLPRLSSRSVCGEPPRTRRPGQHRVGTAFVGKVVRDLLTPEMLVVMPC